MSFQPALFDQETSFINVQFMLAVLLIIWICVFSATTSSCGCSVQDLAESAADEAAASRVLVSFRRDTL